MRSRKLHVSELSSKTNESNVRSIWSPRFWNDAFEGAWVHRDARGRCLGDYGRLRHSILTSDGQQCLAQETITVVCNEDVLRGVHCKICGIAAALRTID